MKLLRVTVEVPVLCKVGLHAWGLPIYRTGRPDYGRFDRCTRRRCRATRYVAGARYGA